ncbi:superoxide dismutase [Flavobacterium sp. SM2513]|uniref:superoxide dismutase n=1 Tax=Flavobacterium sp. SM2513 TaxID=3424766 RepID=UPI003D7F782E
MKNVRIALSIFSVVLIFTSCNEKKLTEVQVPLPEEEVTTIQLGNPADIIANEGAFKMMPLPYSYDALEPYIDAKTMETHYSKHHLGYINKLNEIVSGTTLETLTIEEILKSLDLENKTLRNNAGGYYNHNLYLSNLSSKGGGEPTGSLHAAIVKDFGSFSDFKKQLAETANKQFGSGWAWLVTDKTGKLTTVGTANQDNPLMPNIGVTGTPLLALDVWEHAYYLKYQNKRNNYVEAFFNVINWKIVEKRYDESLKKNQPIKVQ